MMGKTAVDLFASVAKARARIVARFVQQFVKEALECKATCLRTKLSYLK